MENTTLTSRFDIAGVSAMNNDRIRVIASGDLEISATGIQINGAYGTMIFCYPACLDVSTDLREVTK